MLQQLLPLLGNTPANLSLFTEIAGAISLFGLLLWLAGARFSRQIITLCGVAVGALIGKYLPDYCPVNLSPSVLAVGGALIFGIAAYITHRFWIGFSLGLSLAWWAVLGTWALKHGDQSWSQPIWDADMTIGRFGQALWTVLPPDVTRVLPWATGGAMAAGIGLTVLWPRLATALNWSLAGMSLLLSAGLALVNIKHPEWLNMLPVQTWSQVSTFAGLVIFGALLQCKLTPRGRVRIVRSVEAVE